MKTIDIKGKAYVQVNERILYFKNNFDGSIVTELLSNEDGVCIFKAEIFVEGVLKATGHAYEKEGSTFINKTSYIENAETSSVGRALGLLGIGISESIASAEEVGNAIKQQEQKKEEKKKKSADLEVFLDKQIPKGLLEKTWEDNKDRWEKILEKSEWNKLQAFYAQTVKAEEEKAEEDNPF